MNDEAPLILERAPWDDPPPHRRGHGSAVALGVALGVMAAAGVAAAAANVAGAWPLVPAETAAFTARAAPPALPQPPEALQTQLERLADSYGEPVGVAVMDVKDGWMAGVDVSTPYPQQSVSKLWVAIAALDAVDKGAHRLDETVRITEADQSAFYQPIMRKVGADGYMATLNELLRRAITESDNAANDKIIRVLGGPGPIRQVLDDKHLTAVKVGDEERHLQARIAGLEAWRPEYGDKKVLKAARRQLPDDIRQAAISAYLAQPEDGASPAAIVRGLARLYDGELLSPASTQVLLALLAETKTGPNRLSGGAPEGWTVAHKAGTGQDWKQASIGINDVGLMTAPDGRVYAVAVMIRRTERPVPERLEFMRQVAGAVADSWAVASEPAAALQVGS